VYPNETAAESTGCPRGKPGDALARKENARQVMGEPTLRVIAHELVTVIKGNVTVDWMHRDSARASIGRVTAAGPPHELRGEDIGLHGLAVAYRRQLDRCDDH
jgi:hypothetical protein